MISRQTLYRAGEPFGEFCTRIDGLRLVLGAGGGGDNNSTSIQKMEPPDAVKPYLKPFMNQAANLAATPYQAYTGQRIAGFAPEQEAGMQLTAARALQGAPDINATRMNLTDTMSGAYMSPDSNPYLKQMADTALDSVQGRVNSTMRGTGGYGGSAHAETLARSLGDTAANIYGANYNNERTNQMRGMAFAPQMASMDYQDLGALAGVGDARQGMTQNVLTQKYDNWLEAKNYPYKQLDVMGNAIATTMGAGRTTTQTAPDPNKSSPVAGAIGGGLAGYGIAKGLEYSNPWAGAALGATAGLFLR